MTKEERYLEVRRISEKRRDGAPKRKRRALIVRIIFGVGVVLALMIAVIGTQPRNAAKLKRWFFSLTNPYVGDQVIIVEPTASDAGPTEVEDHNAE